MKATTTKKEVAKDKELKKTFDWNKHLDPNHKSKLFFKEGNYMPPEPFIEVAKDPNDKNISLWLKYIEKKNLVAMRLKKRVSDYVKSNRGTSKSGAINNVYRKIKVEPIASNREPGRYKIRMYFDSKCPHCKRMSKSLKALQVNGYFVEALQIDDAPLAQFEIPTQRATPAQVKAEGIQGVPFTLIADLKSKVVLNPIKGFRSANELIGIINQSKLKLK